MILLSKPIFGQEEIDEIKGVFESGWVAGQGPKGNELEADFSKYIGCRYSIAANNCTAGLHLALLALGIKEGDEVIVPDFTYPATAHAVMYVNAKPVFCDIERDTYNIDPKQIESKITSKTKAIIPVHAFGQCANMEEIMKIAKKHKLFVIEDAACGTGSMRNGKHAGTFGDIGCFSFHGRKNITSGEGGINTTNNEELAGKMRSLSCFGIESAYKREKEFKVPIFTKLGFNYKLSDIASGIAVAQLKKSEDFIKKRNELAKYYAEKLANIDGIKVPFVDPKNRHAYQSFVTLLDKRYNRNEIIVKLGELGIQAQIGTYALHVQPMYKEITNCNPADFPNASYIFEKSLAIPMYYTLTEKQIDEVTAALKKVLK